MEQKAKRKRENTTEPATDGLVEMTVKIGRAADNDVTIKRREMEDREEMETETDQDGTEKPKTKMEDLRPDACHETLQNEMVVVNLTSRGLGVRRLKKEEMMPTRPQPNNTNGGGSGDREEAQSGIEQGRQSRIPNGWIQLYPMTLDKLTRKKNFSDGRKA